MGIGRIVVGAALALLLGALPSYADSRRILPPQKLTRTIDNLVGRNAPVLGGALASLPPRRTEMALSIPLTSGPALGLELADSIDPFVAAIGLTGQAGALVFNVPRAGPAARAGLLPGDLIIGVAGDRVRDAGQLERLLRNIGVGTLEIIRIGHGPDDLLKALRIAAAGGNRDAILALGDTSLFNLDGRGQPESAEDYFLTAYAMGDARAAYRLGSMYASGEGVDIDLAVATHWYRIAAGAGLPAAQHALGLTWWNGHYWTGLALESDPVEAVRLFGLAAARGHVPSYIYLGLAHQSGLGVTADPSVAAAWYEKAIAEGDTQAMLRRAAMYEAGEGGDPDPVASLDLLETAARLGSAEASRRLGEKYWRGEGVRQHPLDALVHLRRAAERGDRPSMTLIAQILLSGYGVTRDPAGAVRWYFRAYQAGDADAGYALALAYADGVGVPRDPGKVAGFMLDAIRRGSKPALDEMLGNGAAWDISVREDMQELLRAGGFYSGEIDGVFGPGTVRALNAAARAS